MNATVNLTLKDSATNEIIRVVDINLLTGIANLFKCFKRIPDCEMPYPFPLEDLDKMIKDGNLVLAEDEYINHVDEAHLSPKKISLRDNAFAIVSELVDSDGDIYVPILRNILIKRLRKKTKISKKAVYKYLKKYWRNGLNENALLPDFDKCGAAEKERESGLSKENRSLIRKCFKELVMDKEYSIQTAYEIATQRHKDELKGLQYHTFYHHTQSAFSDEIKKRARMSAEEFARNHRLLNGRSNDIVKGPCKLYQIDSTPRDIKIVSTLNRNQYIGKPTFYVVVDSWSRAVVGVLITLDNPSYISACHALFISFRSKELLIKELDLGPEHLGWSNSFIPDELVADRAEFLGPKADNIVKNLGIRLGNTVAYRPDLKGSVEKIIDIIQERVRDLFLGSGQVLKNDGKRISKDTRLEATVTLEELYQITWIVVNEYNNHHWIEEYPLTDEMVRDGVKKIPAEIHKWGIQQKLGVERTRDEKTLWFCLMDSEEKIPSDKGIRLNKQYYVPENDKDHKILQNLILAPKVKPIKIIYDPRIYKIIYWYHKGNYIKLRLRGEDDAGFLNEWEVKSTNATYNDMRQECQEKEREVKGINNSVIKSKIDKNKSNRKPVVKNSKASKSLQREFNRAKMNLVPKKSKTVHADKKISQSNEMQSKLLKKLKKFNN